MDPSPSNGSSSRRSSSYGGLDPSPSHQQRSRHGSRDRSTSSGRRSRGSSRSPTNTKSRFLDQRKSLSPSSPSTRSNRYSSMMRDNRNDEEAEYEEGMNSYSGRYSVSSSMEDTTTLQSSSKANNANSTPMATSKDGIRSVSSAATPTSPHKDSTTPASGPKSATYLSRKAHRMQRKKRASAAAALGGGGNGSGSMGTSFLNKLFCTSEDSIGTKENKKSSSSSKKKKGGGGGEQPPPNVDEGVCALNDDDTDGCDTATNAATRGCVTFAITDAVASLQLDREASVRRTIQKSMFDAQESVMDVVCTAISETAAAVKKGKCSGFDGSPPTHQVRSDQLSSPGTKSNSSPTKQSLFKSFSDDDNQDEGNTNNNDSSNKDTDTKVVDEDVNKDSWEEPSKFDNMATEEETKARTERETSSPGRRDSPPLSRGGACRTSELNDEEDKYKPILASAAAAIATAVDYKPPSHPLDENYVNDDDDDDNGNGGHGDKYTMKDGLGNDNEKTEVFFHSISEHDAAAFLPNSLVNTLTPKQHNAAPINSNDNDSSNAETTPTAASKPSPLFTWVQVQERLTQAVEKVKEEYDQRLDDEKSLDDQKDLISALQKEREVWQKEHELKMEAALKNKMETALEQAKKEWQAQHEQELSQATSECQSLEQALSDKEKILEIERAKLQAKLQQEFQDQLNQQKDQVQLAKRRAAQQESELDVYMTELQQSNGLVQELEEKIQRYESQSVEEQSIAEELQLKEQVLTDLREQVSKLEMSKSMEDGTVFEQLQAKDETLQELQEQVSKLETAKSIEEQTLQKQLKSKDQALQEMQEQMGKMEISLSNVTNSADGEQASALQEQLKVKEQALQELQEHVKKLESMNNLDETLLEQKLKAKDLALHKLQEQVHKFESSSNASFGSDATAPSSDEQKSTMIQLPEQLKAKDEEIKRLQQLVAELETFKAKAEEHETIQEQPKAEEQDQEQLQAKKTGANDESELIEQLKNKDGELQRLKEQFAELETSKNMVSDEHAALQEKLKYMDEELQDAIQAKEELDREKEMQVCKARKLQDKLHKQQQTATTTASSPPNSPTIEVAASNSMTISTSTSKDRDRPVVDMQEELRNLQERLKTRSSSPTKALSPTRQQKFDQEKQTMEKSFEGKMQETRDDYEAQLEDLRSQIKQLQDQIDEDPLANREKQAQAQIEAAEQQVREQSHQQQVAELEVQLAELKELEQSHQQQVKDLEGSVQAQQELVREKGAQLEQAQTQIAELSKQQEEEETTAELFEQYEKELGNFQRDIKNLEKQKEEQASSLQSDLDKLKEQLEVKDKELEQARLAGSHQIKSSPARHASPSSVRSSSSITPVRARSPSGIRPPSSNRKETSIELHEREKEALRQQISVLESQLTTMNQQHENALDEIRRKSEQELVDIRKDMEARIEKHMKTERDLKDTLATVDSADKEDLLERIEQLEAEKKADRGGCLREVQKKEELLQRITTLEKREKELLKEQEIALQDVRANSEAEIQRLHKEIEKEKAESFEKEQALQQAISETESFEKEELLQRIDKLEALLENERNGAVLVKMKVGNMDKELTAAREAHREEVTKLQTKSEAEIKHLNGELQELSAIEDAMQITTNERDVLEEEVKRLKQKLEDDQQLHEEEQDKMKTRHAQELDTLQKESSEAMELAGHEAQDRIKELEMKLEVSETENAEILSRQGLSPGEEKVLRDELQGIKSQLEHDKIRFEDQTTKLKEEHGKKCEEIRSQHTTVENEHKERVAALEKAASEKDAIITALGSQLAEAQSRTKGVEEERQKLAKELDRTKSEAMKLDNDLVKLRGELRKLRDAHDSYMNDAAVAKEAAAEQAREEMIERAEVQFKQANDLYVKLKKQYDICKRKVDTLEKELKRQKEISAKAGSKEIDLKTEIATLKASNAKAETDSTRKGREYRREMERLLEAAETFENKNKAAEKKCDAAEASSRHAQKKLSGLQADNAKLKTELVEVKSVCEELMAMVEGQHHEC